MALQQRATLPFIVSTADSERSYGINPSFQCTCATVSIPNAAVAAWIQRWLSGGKGTNSISLFFSLPTEAIFHGYGAFKVKQTTLEDLAIQHNNK